MRRQSFISLGQVEFTDPGDAFQWVFFSSPNSVCFYFSRAKVNDSVRYAALGRATAKSLQAVTGRVDFEGDGSDTIAIGKTFSRVLAGEEKVLFPLSDQSLRSVSAVLPPNQVVELVVYRNRPMPAELKNDYHTVLFTSPSNVDAFMADNRAPAVAVAIGEQTSARLAAYGINAVIAHGFGPSGLFAAVLEAN